jgi:hypothetical protein
MASHPKPSTMCLVLDFDFCSAVLQANSTPIDGRCNTDRSECIVCAKERRELSLPAAAGGGL